MHIHYKEVRSESFTFKVRNISTDDQRLILIEKFREYLERTKKYKATHKLLDAIGDEKTHYGYFYQLSKFFSPDFRFYDKQDNQTWLSITCQDKSLESIRISFEEYVKKNNEYLERKQTDTYDYFESSISRKINELLQGEHDKHEALQNVTQALNALNLLFTELREVKKAIESLEFEK